MPKKIETKKTVRHTTKSPKPVVATARRPMIDPISAVKKFWLGYFNFMGRSTRSEFWFGILFAIIVDILFMIFVGGIISRIVSLALVIPSMALITRRFRDAGISIWLYLIPALALYLVPVIAGASWYQASVGGNVTMGMQIYSLCFLAFFIFEIVVACIPSKR